MISDEDRALIRAAAATYRVAGAQDAAMRDASGLTATRAWQRVNRLLGDPAAWEAEPVALGMLRRRRDAQRRARRSGETQ